MRGISHQSPAATLAACLALWLPSIAQGGGIPTSSPWLEEVVVTAKLDRLTGEPLAATMGVVTSEQLDLRPTLRTGELLEVVPGLVVTQHSGRDAASWRHRGHPPVETA